MVKMKQITHKSKNRKNFFKLKSKIKAGVYVGLNLSGGSGRMVAES